MSLLQPTVRRSVWTRIALGGALGIALGSSPGCSGDRAEFIEDYATEICRMVDDCGAELVLPGEEETLIPGDWCMETVRAHYEACGDACEFRAGKARRCLRRLEDNVCSQPSASSEGRSEGDENIPPVCDDVFRDCAGHGDGQCQAPRVDCSVSSESPGSRSLLALGLLLLGLSARRRRD